MASGLPAETARSRRPSPGCQPAGAGHGPWAVGRLRPLHLRLRWLPFPSKPAGPEAPRSASLGRHLVFESLTAGGSQPSGKHRRCLLFAFVSVFPALLLGSVVRAGVGPDYSGGSDTACSQGSAPAGTLCPGLALTGQRELQSPPVCTKPPRSCPTLCHPWAVGHQAALSMGLSRREYWSGLPCPPPGTFLTQGSNPRLLCLLHRQAGSLQLGPLGSGETAPLVSAFFVFKKHIYLYGERERERKSGAKGSTGARLYFPLISATY